MPVCFARSEGLRGRLPIEVEEIPLAKPFVEDSDVIEDAVSSGESAHGVWSERIG